MTYNDIFKEVLIDVRQYSSATLYPVEFNRFWNKEMMSWVQLRASEDELNDKRNQDLQRLKIVEQISNTGGNTAGSEVFAIPYSSSKMNTSANPGFKNFGFLRIESISVNGIYTECDVKKDSGWIAMMPWIKDETKHVDNNPFRKPIVSSAIQDVYYEVRGFNIYIHAGSNFVGSKIKLEYLRYPEFADVEASPNTEFELPIYVKDEIASRVRSEFLAKNGSPLYPGSINQQRTTVN